MENCSSLILNPAVVESFNEGVKSYSFNVSGYFFSAHFVGQQVVKNSHKFPENCLGFQNMSTNTRIGTHRCCKGLLASTRTSLDSAYYFFSNKIQTHFLRQERFPVVFTPVKEPPFRSVMPSCTHLSPCPLG